MGCQGKNGQSAAVGAQTVLALCPCCEFQLRVSKDKKNVPIEVRDLAAFACQSLGKTLADPSPEVDRQWKVFEGMDNLMSHMIDDLVPLAVPKMIAFLRGKSTA